MTNLKTSLKIAILALVGLIMSSIAFSLTGFEIIVYLIYVFAIAFVVSLTVYISGFVNRNISSSKNINAIILFLFGAVISFIMNAFLEMELFDYIGIICVVLLLISVFVLIARKLFKNELSSVNKTLSEKIEANNTNTTTTPNANSNTTDNTEKN